MLVMRIVCNLFTSKFSLSACNFFNKQQQTRLKKEVLGICRNISASSTNRKLLIRCCLTNYCDNC